MTEQLMPEPYLEVTMMGGDAWALTEEQAAHVSQRIVANYGLAMVRSKWQSLTPKELKIEIARQLGPFTWSVILQALDLMPSRFEDYPPNIGQLVGLCKSCEPVKTTKALPSPEIDAETKARRMEAAGATLKSIDSVGSDNRTWAEKLRARYLRGETLPLASVIAGSATMKETWKTVNGTRVCTPLYDKAMG